MKWFGIPAALTVVAVGAIWLTRQGPVVVDAQLATDNTQASPVSTQTVETKTTEGTAPANQEPGRDQVSHSHAASAATDAHGKPISDHASKMSPPVKEALKQGLLLESSMDVVELPDGRVKLPSNGRFTQMPVAVTEEDGSISVREYVTAPQ